MMIFHEQSVFLFGMESSGVRARGRAKEIERESYREMEGG